MNRRLFLAQSSTAIFGGAGFLLAGCRHGPSAEVMNESQRDKVGTTAAGAETYKPMIEEAVGKLLARQSVTPGIQPVAVQAKRICFIGLENKSSEELGDFKDQICQIIDQRIIDSRVFMPISRKFVEVGLREARMRPDTLLIPANQRRFQAIMEQQGQSFEYLLFATLSSGTTHGNGSMQREYMLSLELVNINTGAPADMESARIRKAYRR